MRLKLNKEREKNSIQNPIGWTTYSMVVPPLYKDPCKFFDEFNGFILPFHRGDGMNMCSPCMKAPRAANGDDSESLTIMLNV